MSKEFTAILEDCPIIAAVKDMDGLERCLESDINLVFILFGDICNIESIVKRIKEASKIAMVHVDLISGLSGKEIALDFIKEHTMADGIITTKQMLIKHAKELSFYTILRYFIIDSLALINIEKQHSSIYPDCIEILPGVMPKIIKKVCASSRIPVIAGGLIADKEDVMSALTNGAVSISTTKSEIWFM